MDDIPAYGASIEVKNDGTFRIASQNTNGMRLGSIYAGVEELDVMEQLGIDVMCLQETNLAWNTDTRAMLAALIHLKFGYRFAITASAPI